MALEISFDLRLTVTRKSKILRDNERRRFQGHIEVELQTQGYKWTGLKLPAKTQLLKQDMEEKEEHAGSEYDINITEYFKLVSSTDQSIFDMTDP
jgi:hypothetical protein